MEGDFLVVVYVVEENKVATRCLGRYDSPVKQIRHNEVVKVNVISRVNSRYLAKSLKIVIHHSPSFGSFPRIRPAHVIASSTVFEAC